VHTKEDAERAIIPLDSLKEYAFVVSNSKFEILKGPICLTGIDNLLEIQTVKKVKYLCYTLTATRSQLYQSAQASI
jgi:hypothetical protein